MKVFLHKAGTESQVFDTESEAYEAALKGGWSTEREADKGGNSTGKELKEQPQEDFKEENVKLSDMTVKQLKEIADGIDGLEYESKIKKDDLIDLILGGQDEE